MPIATVALTQLTCFIPPLCFYASCLDELSYLNLWISFFTFREGSRSFGAECALHYWGVLQHGPSLFSPFATVSLSPSSLTIFLCPFLTETVSLPTHPCHNCPKRFAFLHPYFLEILGGSPLSAQDWGFFSSPPPSSCTHLFPHLFLIGLFPRTGVCPNFPTPHQS